MHASHPVRISRVSPRRVTQLERENTTLKAQLALLLKKGGGSAHNGADGMAASALDASALGGNVGALVASSADEDAPSAEDASAEDAAFAAEQMEAEMEFLAKQGELSEQLEMAALIAR